MNLVQDVQQFQNFIDNVLPSLLPHEVYFVSLSARNKYLTERERDFYGLGRTEMFARTLVRRGDWGKAIRKLEGELATRLTKTGQLIPERALVVYVNINPSDALAAHFKYINEVNRQLEEVTKATVRDKSPNYTPFTFAEKTLLNCFQVCTGQRTYLDLDIDTKEERYLSKVRSVLDSKNVSYFVVETHGGFHVLVKRETLNKSNVRLDLLVKELARESGKEIMFNKNAMIPMPGTKQAGHLVKLVL